MRISDWSSDVCSSDLKLHANAEIQIALRDKDGRSKILEQLIREVCPDGVSGAQWRAWLVGGRSPFDVQPKKAAPGKERPSQTLVRSSNRVRGQEKKVDRLRSALLEAEEELRFVKAYENAAVHWHVVDQLIEIMISEERRVGKECVSKFRSRGSPYH